MSPKLIGKTMDFIYQDRQGQISQRNIHVLMIKEGKVHAIESLWLLTGPGQFA